MGGSSRRRSGSGIALGNQRAWIDAQQQADHDQNQGPDAADDKSATPGAPLIFDILTFAVLLPTHGSALSDKSCIMTEPRR
jgi:hypothetical protein